MKDAAQRARHLLRSHYQGALATLDAEGMPFASALHYACDHQGSPWFLLSHLAEHTRRLLADPRASLLVWQPGQDLLAAARMTLLGRVVAAEPDDALRARLLRLLPGATRYLALPGFHFYTLQVERVRLIAGFGEMGWVDGDAHVFPVQGDLSVAEAGVVAHMNADHREAVAAYCRRLGGLPGEEAAAEMLACDPEGMDLDCAGQRLRVDFPAPVQDVKALREALVAMAREKGGA